jgi:hypothetical protein
LATVTTIRLIPFYTYGFPLCVRKIAHVNRFPHDPVPFEKGHLYSICIHVFSPPKELQKIAQLAHSINSTVKAAYAFTVKVHDRIFVLDLCVTENPSIVRRITHSHLLPLTYGTPLTPQYRIKFTLRRGAEPHLPPSLRVEGLVDERTMLIYRH